MKEVDKVKRYFQRSIEDFDLLYTDEKSAFRRFIDRRFRYDNYQRFELTIKECLEIKGKRILDVGCGTGRYSVQLARLGASEVHGIDLCSNAIELARKLSMTENTTDICSFECIDFLQKDFNCQYDITIAMGLFDYIADPLPFLSKMRDITREKIIASFPSKSTYRMIFRKLRYWLKGCPVYFYDKNMIITLLEKIGVKRYKITKLDGHDNSGDYFVVIELI